MSFLSDEINASLASVWARYVGARPSGATIQVDSGAVRWTVPEGTEQFEQGLSDGGEAADTTKPVRTAIGYKRETAAAVAKLTHRRVSAVISKHDAKTGIATETFILAAAHRRN